MNGSVKSSKRWVNNYWLVVWTPLKNISQLGWWHSQYIWENKKKANKQPTRQVLIEIGSSFLALKIPFLLVKSAYFLGRFARWNWEILLVPLFCDSSIPVSTASTPICCCHKSQFLPVFCLFLSVRSVGSHFFQMLKAQDPQRWTESWPYRGCVPATRAWLRLRRYLQIKRRTHRDTRDFQWCCMAIKYYEYQMIWICYVNI